MMLGSSQTDFTRVDTHSHSLQGCPKLIPWKTDKQLLATLPPAVAMLHSPVCIYSFYLSKLALQTVQTACLSL